MEKIKYKGDEYEVVGECKIAFQKDYVQLQLQRVPKSPSLEQVFTHLAKGNDVQFNDCVYRMMGDELHHCLKPTGSWSATKEPAFLTPFYLKHCRLI